MVVEGKNYWFRAPVKRHTTNSEFNIDDIKALPAVDIVYGYGNMNTTGIDAYGKGGGRLGKGKRCVVKIISLAQLFGRPSRALHV